MTPKVRKSISVEMEASCTVLSQLQADRELEEALRVQSMSPRERTRWLDQTWGKLQRQATRMYEGIERPRAEPRYFDNLDDKNRYDEERELAFAVAVALARRKKGSR